MVTFGRGSLVEPGFKHLSSTIMIIVYFQACFWFRQCWTWKIRENRKQTCFLSSQWQNVPLCGIVTNLKQWTSSFFVGVKLWSSGAGSQLCKPWSSQKITLKKLFNLCSLGLINTLTHNRVQLVNLSIIFPFWKSKQKIHEISITCFCKAIFVYLEIWIFPL